MRTARLFSALLLALWSGVVAGNLLTALHLGADHAHETVEPGHHHDGDGHHHHHDHAAPATAGSAADDHEHRALHLDPASTTRFDAAGLSALPALLPVIRPLEACVFRMAGRAVIPAESPPEPQRPRHVILLI
jgi:hypothetical protein